MTNQHSDTTDIFDDEFRTILPDGKLLRPSLGGRRQHFLLWELIVVVIIVL